MTTEPEWTDADDPVDGQAWQTLQDWFALVHRWQFEGPGGELPYQPDPGSDMAADDLAVPDSLLSISALYSLRCAVDHLHCLRAAVQEASTLHTAAPFTLIRAAIESTARALWMTGPPERADRVLHRLWVERGDLDLRATFVKATGLTYNRSRTEASIRDAAVAVGLDPATFAKRKRLPSDTAMICVAAEFTRVGGHQTLADWRACSGMAHGRFWVAALLPDIAAGPHPGRPSLSLITNLPLFADLMTRTMNLLIDARGIYIQRASASA